MSNYLQEARFMADRLRFRRAPVAYAFGRWRMNEHVAFLADEAARAGDEVTSRRLNDWVAKQRALVPQVVPERPSSDGRPRLRQE